MLSLANSFNFMKVKLFPQITKYIKLYIKHNIITSLWAKYGENTMLCI